MPDVRQKLIGLLDYVEQVVRLDERVAFRLSEYRLPDGSAFAVGKAIRKIFLVCVTISATMRDPFGWRLNVSLERNLLLHRKTLQSGLRCRPIRRVRRKYVRSVW